MSKISEETLVEVLLRAKKGESPAALAREYGIGLTTVKRWRRGTQRVSKGFTPEPLRNNSASEKKIKELEKKLEGLTLLLADAFDALKKQQNEN
ncbi:MAG: helix-turn-helix domain-containing protein [Candidatus Caenarcaniphilales bacterium]|jgi:transposase-like protein|nr:helix-turn-helix domain-containing protein [Candidatus Caenarcaniphilales bacterium]